MLLVPVSPVPSSQLPPSPSVYELVQPCASIPPFSYLPVSSPLALGAPLQLCGPFLPAIIVCAVIPSFCLIIVVSAFLSQSSPFQPSFAFLPPQALPFLLALAFVSPPIVAVIACDFPQQPFCLLPVSSSSTPPIPSCASLLALVAAWFLPSFVRAPQPLSVFAACLTPALSSAVRLQVFAFTPSRASLPAVVDAYRPPPSFEAIISLVVLPVISLFVLPL